MSELKPYMEGKPTRERCVMCWKISSIGFHVPKEIWTACVHPKWVNSILCVHCFVSQADEKLIEWDKYITFYPVSLATHLKVVQNNERGGCDD